MNRTLFFTFILANAVVAATWAAPAQKTLVPINLALHKPATASASQPGNEPEHAVDGDPSTRWCAPNPDSGHWWEVDLQKAEDVTGCRVTWEKEHHLYHHKIEGSADGKTWQMLVDGVSS